MKRLQLVLVSPVDKTHVNFKFIEILLIVNPHLVEIRILQCLLRTYALVRVEDKHPSQQIDTSLVNSWIHV